MKSAKSAALLIAFCVAAFVVLSADASAQVRPGTPDTTTATDGPMARFNGIGIGLVILGAGLGIGKLTASAVESMARQPELAGTIQTAMIISAALIEGVAFFALILLGFIIANS